MISLTFFRGIARAMFVVTGALGLMAIVGCGGGDGNGAPQSVSPEPCGSEKDDRQLKDASSANLPLAYVNKIVVKGSDISGRSALNDVIAHGMSVLKIGTNLPGLELHVERWQLANVAILKLNRSVDSSMALAIANSIASDARVDFAEPDYRISALDIPNDTLFPEQWYLADPEFGINIAQAWEKVKVRLRL